ncbi:MAG: cellulose binding domain-containing protein, partial [Demequina sp.]|uniref:cellulose binding domain-containing protein n=1 Tax=Demequina sp. TaxID=2050685 RepID=UPI003A84C156
MTDITPPTSAPQRAPWWRRPLVLVPGAIVAAGLLVAAGWGLARASGDDDTPPTESVTPSASATPSSSPTAAAATGTCTAEVKITQEWEGGFQADATVTAGDTAITGWTVTLTVGDATVDGTWNSTLKSGASGTVEASNVDYNAALAAGGTAEFGFTAKGDAAVTVADCTATGGDTTGSERVDDDGPGAAGDASAPLNAASGDDWLSVDGNRIVDADGLAVWLTVANWLVFNTSERVLQGLWAANLHDTLVEYADHGLN